MSKSASRRTSLWALAYAVGPMVLAIDSRESIVDNSFLWHITAGQVQRDLGRVITHDPFSFTALGESWRTQSWLVDIGYAWAVEVFGIGVAQLIPWVVGGVLFGVVSVLARANAATGLATAAVLFASTVVLMPFLQPRPVIFSYLFLGLTVLAGRSRRLLWTVPLILVVWAAVHGSFLLGLVYLATQWWRTRESSLVLPSVVGAALVNLLPHGVMIWEVLFEFSRSGPALARISEWQPPDLVGIHLMPLTLALVVVIGHIASNGRPARELLPFVAWMLFGLSSTRSVPLLWLVMVPPLARGLSGLFERFVLRATIGRNIGHVTMALLVVWPVVLPRDAPLDDGRFPIEAARHLTDERVFHDDITGGYLIYAQWPERLVYIDDRAELYGQRLVEFADTKSGGPDWRDVVDGTGATQALVRRSDAVASVLMEAPEWVVRYEDEVFLVFDRLTD